MATTAGRAPSGASRTGAAIGRLQRRPFGGRAPVAVAPACARTLARGGAADDAGIAGPNARRPAQRGVHRCARAATGGVISYSRGHIEILDQEALRKTSCECYRVVKSKQTRLLG